VTMRTSSIAAILIAFAIVFALQWAIKHRATIDASGNPVVLRGGVQ
jgi:hypothetical protein